MSRVSWELTSEGRVRVVTGVVRVAYMNPKDQEAPGDVARSLRDRLFEPRDKALVTTGSALVERYKTGRSWGQWALFLAVPASRTHRATIDVFVLPAARIGRGTAQVCLLALSDHGPPRVLLVRGHRLVRVTRIVEINRWQFEAQADELAEPDVMDILFAPDETP